MQFLANQALGRRKFVLRKNRQPPSRVRLPDRCPFFVHSTALSFRFFPFRFVLSPAMSPLRLNPIQVHFLVQRAPAYAQQSGGLFPIMPGLFQSLAYPLLFHAFPFQGNVRIGRLSGLIQVQFFRRHQFPLGKKHGGLDRLFQFPYVSRPVMGQQPFLRLHRNLLPVCHALGCKVPGRIQQAAGCLPGIP